MLLGQASRMMPAYFTATYQLYDKHDKAHVRAQWA
jgi:hypothetical protein